MDCGVASAFNEDDGAMRTLREQLERHRNQKGCAKCRSGIDPWGIPFETFDAGGLWLGRETGHTIKPGADARSTLPDKAEIKDRHINNCRILAEVTRSTDEASVGVTRRPLRDE